MLKPCSSRWFYFSEFLVVAGLLAFAYYLEFYRGLLPCDLCEMQRLAFGVLGLLFLMAIFVPLRKWPQVAINSVLALMALPGALLAGRQVWLQYVPVTWGAGSCDASLQYMLHVLSWSQALLNVFLGGPECAKVSWQFLGLSIAGWSLLWFVVFFLLAVWQGLGWLLK